MGRKFTKLELTPQLPARKKVAAYARVSSGVDHMLHSLAAQVSFYAEYIQNHPEWEYAGVFADAAQTGTKDNRPEFQRLLAECRVGRVDLVLTKSISRFARNTITLLESVRELKELGIGVYFEEQNINTLSADGELMLTILASYAQEESRSVSENIKWRIRNDYKQGKPSTHVRIYGYDYHEGAFTIIPEEAEIVKMIFDDYLSGLSTTAIANKLHRLGIPSKNGIPWAHGTIRAILANEKYTGDVHLQKGFVADHLTKQWKPNNGELPKYIIEGNHEPIIDHDTFTAAQAETARRSTTTSKRKPRTISEFTSLITCGKCGAKFTRKINGRGTKYARPLWACPTFTNRGKAACNAKRIREDILQEKTIEALGLAVYDPAAVTLMVTSILTPDDGILIFTLRVGSTREITWQNRSRRDVWTDEMRATAAEHARKGNQNRCQTSP